jgi:small subunit ribosomal protein S3
MGQKINPKGFRIGTVFNWGSRWFADNKQYKELVYQDAMLRELLAAKLKPAGLAQIVIERSINKVKLTLYVSRPGVVIGRGGSGLEELKKYIEKHIFSHGKSVNPYEAGRSASDTARMKVELAVEPVKEPNLNAFLVAQTISDQLIRRMPQKRICNQAIERVMNSGAKGVKILLSGRIAGAEIARREKYGAGTVPLSTIREEVDFAIVPALTKSGYIGVKVWICRKSSVN